MLLLNPLGQWGGGDNEAKDSNQVPTPTRSSAAPEVVQKQDNAGSESLRRPQSSDSDAEEILFPAGSSMQDIMATIEEMRTRGRARRVSQENSSEPHDPTTCADCIQRAALAASSTSRGSNRGRLAVQPQVLRILDLSSMLAQSGINEQETLGARGGFVTQVFVMPIDLETAVRLGLLPASQRPSTTDKTIQPGNGAVDPKDPA